MCREKLRGFVRVSGIIIALLYITSLSHAQTLNDIISTEKAHPKIQSALEQFTQKIVSDRAGQRRPLDASTEEKIVVFIIAEPGKTAETIDKEGLLAYGVEIIKSKSGVMKAKIPISQIQSIADNIKGVSFIQLPDTPVSQAYAGEGASVTQAATFHTQGYTGKGVKVAIIDLGFSKLSAAIANGDLPGSLKFVDCTGSICLSRVYPWDILFESIGHGTAVAEIVRDMAPESDLYLIKINDPADLDDAVSFCIDNGIKIVNQSLGWWNTNFYDGKCWTDFGNPVCSVNDAFAHSILWVNAAGNYAKRHYSAIYTDQDNNGYHDQVITIKASAGDTIQLDVTWNAWPRTDQDYDLYLTDGNYNTVRSSKTVQSGTQKPTEEIIYSVPSTGTYYLFVKKYNAIFNHRFEIYSIGYHEITPSIASGSLISPADADGAIAVGAVNQQNWTTGPIASYSSQGPRNDGMMKLEITGPDAVSTKTYGVRGFSGTSAASPHVAGAAALIQSRNPEYSVFQLVPALLTWAVDMGSPGPDNIYGYGRLSLPCFVDISTNNKIHTLQSASGSISVSESTNSCPWYVKSLDTWITVTTGVTGSGNGTVGYSVAENKGSERTGRILIGDRTFTIIQTNTILFTQTQLDQAVTDAKAAKDLIITERDKSITSLNATIASMFTQAQLDKAVSDANAAKDQTIASMFTKAQLDKAVTDANAAKDLIISYMYTKTQLDKAVVDANAAKDLIITDRDKSIASLNTAIASMFSKTQLDNAVADANSAKDTIIAQKDTTIASMYTKAQLDKSVSDANAAKDLVIALMFTKQQLDKAVVEERIKWDVNNDGKMSLVEVIYILQQMAGMR